MKLIFFGTPEFAVPSLEKLTKFHEIIYCVTQPDKRQGRGLKPISTPVRKKAEKLGLPVLTPISLKEEAFLETLHQASPDLQVVVAFSILPAEILAIPKFGSINLHPSLLPKYRGAAPIERAIMAGEKTTGISVFLLEKSLDQGPILMQREAVIGEDETGGELRIRLATEGAEVLVETISLLEKGELNPKMQDPRFASWAPKIQAQDCEINWQENAEHIRNLIRALNPEPGAHTFRRIKGRATRVKIWQAQVRVDQALPPGVVSTKADAPLIVGCGRYSLAVICLQQEGKKRMNAAEFLRGSRVEEGETWGSF